MNYKLEWLKRKSKLVGIYKIKDKSSERCYIGKSTDIFDRFKTHVMSLVFGNHHNKELQSIYNNTGITNLSFEVIEVLDEFSSEELLSTREIYWWSRELNPINNKPTVQKKERVVNKKKRKTKKVLP